MRLFFQDGIAAGLDLPWFEDVKPGRVMVFPLCTTNPPTKIFYRVTEEFNQGRRILVQANYEEMKTFRTELCDTVIADLKNELRTHRRELIWNSFGFVSCIGWLVVNLLDAYKGEWLAILWQIIAAFLFVFAACLIKVSVLKRRKIRYALDGMQKMRETENPSRTDMLADQVVAALTDAERVGIPTLHPSRKI